MKKLCATYDLLFGIVFYVLQKLGAYENVGIPEFFKSDRLEKKTLLLPKPYNAIGNEKQDDQDKELCSDLFP